MVGFKSKSAAMRYYKKYNATHRSSKASFPERTKAGYGGRKWNVRIKFGR